MIIHIFLSEGRTSYIAPVCRQFPDTAGIQLNRMSMTFSRQFVKLDRLRTLAKASASISLISAFGYYSTQDAGTRSIVNRYTLDSAVFCLAKTMKPNEERKGIPSFKCCGEDSFAIAENDHQIVLAVADGVGGWRKKGIDPSKFSQSLMHHLKQTVQGEDEAKAGLWAKLGGANDYEYKVPTQIKDEAMNPEELLRHAFWRMIRSFHRGLEKPFGSSTACLVSLNKATGVLDTANLGDSGFLILRDANIVGRSKSQQYRFNAPYQITLAPDGNVSDTTHTVAHQSWQLQEGDLLVLGTDGLWDNLFEQDITRILGQERTPEQMARSLVMNARAASERSEYDSPFSVEARKHGIDKFTGGKEDDITVLVSKVRLQSS